MDILIVRDMQIMKQAFSNTKGDKFINSYQVY